MEEIEVVLQRHEQQIKTLERDIPSTTSRLPQQHCSQPSPRVSWPPEPVFMPISYSCRSVKTNNAEANASALPLHWACLCRRHNSAKAEAMGS